MSRAAGQRAPLDHYWSLAIEEQFYWVWPLALIVVLRLTPRAAARRRGVADRWPRRSRRSSIVGGLGRRRDVLRDSGAAARDPRRVRGRRGAASSPVARRARWPRTAGLALALGRGSRRSCGPPWRGRRSGGPAYHGWFPAFAVASAAVIVGLQAASPLRRLMSVAPLVLLGRISYGVYLYHWPVYTLVDERRFDIGRAPLFAIRAAITLAIAARVVRRRRAADPQPTLRVADRRSVSPRRRARSSLRGGVRARPRRQLHVRGTRDAGRVPRSRDWPTARRSCRSPPRNSARAFPTGLSRPARVMIVGDSTAYATGEGMVQWSAEHPDVMRVTPFAAVGCGLNATGMLPDDGYRETCNRRPAWHRRSRREPCNPTRSVAMVTFRDMEDRMWNPAEGVLTPTDDAFRQHLLDGYEVFTSQVLDAGATRGDLGDPAESRICRRSATSRRCSTTTGSRRIGGCSGRCR